MQKPYTIHSMELGPMENFIYLLVDEETQHAAVIDPAWEPQAILDKAKQLGVTITDILLTHSHHDHINGVEAVLNTHDAQLHLLKDEAAFWGAKLSKPTLHHGGDQIRLGKTDIDILHTPGHTPGSACYMIGDDIITGDTLFVFGCGRCDLQGGDPEQMFTTLKRLGSELPGQTIVHPGHNYSEKETCSMNEQTEGNPFMHIDHLDRFVDYRMHQHDKIRNSPYGPVPRENKKSE